MIDLLHFKIFGCILVLSLLGCRQTPSPSVFNREEVRSEIRQMLVDYHTSINKGGLMAEFEYLDSSKQFFWVPPGYRSALDFDSVRTILTANSKAMKTVYFEWHQLEIHPLSDSLATYTGIVNGRITDTSNTVSEMSIIESGSIIKRASGWKLLCGQSALLEEDQ